MATEESEVQYYLINGFTGAQMNPDQVPSLNELPGAESRNAREQTHHATVATIDAETASRAVKDLSTGKASSLGQALQQQRKERAEARRSPVARARQVSGLTDRWDDNGLLKDRSRNNPIYERNLARVKGLQGPQARDVAKEAAKDVLVKDGKQVIQDNAGEVIAAVNTNSSGNLIPGFTPMSMAESLADAGGSTMASAGNNAPTGSSFISTASQPVSNFGWKPDDENTECGICTKTISLYRPVWIHDGVEYTPNKWPSAEAGGESDGGGNNEEFTANEGWICTGIAPGNVWATLRVESGGPTTMYICSEKTESMDQDTPEEGEEPKVVKYYNVRVLAANGTGVRQVQVGPIITTTGGGEAAPAPVDKPKRWDLRVVDSQVQIYRPDLEVITPGGAQSSDIYTDLTPVNAAADEADGWYVVDTTNVSCSYQDLVADLTCSGKVNIRIRTDNDSTALYCSDHLGGFTIFSGVGQVKEGSNNSYCIVPGRDTGNDAYLIRYTGASGAYGLVYECTQGQRDWVLNNNAALDSSKRYYLGQKLVRQLIAGGYGLVVKESAPTFIESGSNVIIWDTFPIAVLPHSKLHMQ